MLSSFSKFFICIIGFIMVIFYSELSIGSDNSTSVEEKPVPAFTDHILEQKYSTNWYYSIVYPQFGIKNIDETLLRYAKELTEKVTKKEELEDKELNEKNQDYCTGSCGLYMPSPGYLSVVFYSWYYADGMPHGNWVRWGMTFDLKKDVQIDIKDIFTDWTKAKRHFPELIRKSFIEDDECKDADLLEIVTDESRWGDPCNFFLTSNGLGIIFTFSDPSRWSCSVAFIEKEDLIKIGAKPIFWNH